MANDITILDVAQFMLEHGPKLWQIISFVISSQRQVEARIIAIDKKVDQLLIRDIQSSFQLIEGLAGVASPSMRDRHLAQAESGLLRNIGLSRDETIAEMPGRSWVARCYFGLAVIASMREEKTDAARFLLEVFTTDPRGGREVLAADFYAKMFLPHCDDVFQKRDNELAKLPEYLARKSRIEKELFWVGLKYGGLTGALAVGGYLMRNRQAVSGVSLAWREWDEKSGPLRRALELIPSKPSIEEDARNALDARCREIASKILKEGSYAPVSLSTMTQPPLPK